MLAGRSLTMASASSNLPSRQFLCQIKDALENLYDLVYLRRHALVSCLVPAALAGGIKGAKILRERILEAIEDLKPCEETEGTERLWRTYRILHSRYVTALPYREVMYDLGLSQAQYHREQRRAIEDLATVLWESYRCTDIDVPPPLPLVLTKANLTTLYGSARSAPKRGKIPRREQEYVWVAANTDDPFYEDGKRGWEAAARALGVSALFVGPHEADPLAQQRTLERAIARPMTAGILVYPLSYLAVDPLLRRARQQGIAVVLGNADAEDHALRDAFVGPVNTELGSQAALLAAELLKGSGKVAVVGFLGKSPRTRVRAFEERLAAAHPEIELAQIAATDGSAQDAVNVTNALLAMHPDIDLIFVPEARSPLAVASLVGDRGLGGQVMIIGMDRSPRMLDAIAAGTITATVVQDTYAEEYIALHFLFWKYNNLTAIPDTTIVRTTTDSVPSMMRELVFSTPHPQFRHAAPAVHSGHLDAADLHRMHELVSPA